jgi:hypothetical protein
VTFYTEDSGDSGALDIGNKIIASQSNYDAESLQVGDSIVV